MGGSSKKQPLGFKYYLGMHLVLCQATPDRILRIRVDKRTAWEGSVTAGRIDIEAPKLFGGEKKEGGIVGAVDFETGAPDQAVNDYLAAKLGALTSAFRGVTALVLRQVYLGLNPYLKPWSARVQRIHIRDSGRTQWYDAKAAIPAPSSGEPIKKWVLDDNGIPIHESGRPMLFEFKHGISPASSNTSPETFDNFDSALARIRELYGAEMQYVGFFSNDQPALDLFGEGVTGYSLAFSSLETCPDYIYLCFASEQPAQIVPYSGLEHPGGSLFCSPLSLAGLTTIGGPYLLSNVCRNYPSGVCTNTQIDMDGGSPSTYSSYQYGHGGLLRLVNGSLPLPEHYTDGGLGDTANNCTGMPGSPTALLQPFKVVRVSRLSGGIDEFDMNPSHIIRECLTDPDWGMGYADADVDDDSFTVAADTLYAEGFGLSTLWSRSTTIEDFIKEILRHIDAVLYVENGKFTLKLARDDYDAELIPELNETNVQKVENLRRPALGELVNSVTVRSWDRDTAEDAAVTIHDDALLQLQGREINHAVDYPAITHGVNRRRVALRDLKALSTPLASCTVIANRAAAGLRPGGVFKLTWPDGGLSAAIMRVVKISFGDAARSTIKIECVEDIFAFPESQVRGTPSTGWTDPSGPPAASPARLVIEAPYLEIVQYLGQSQADQELAAVPEAGYLLVAAQRPSDDALNAEIQVDAGAGYAEAGTLDFCQTATLAAAIDPLDTEIALSNSVDLEDVTLGSLAQLGDELVRIDAITDTAATIGRGVLDTVPTAHEVGERLWAIDLYAGSDYRQYVSGEALAVKVLPATGSGELPLVAAPIDNIVMDGRAYRPYPPGDLKFNGGHFPETLDSSADIVLTWASRNRLQQTSGMLLDFFDSSVTTELGVTYTVRGLDSSNLTSVVYEASGITTLTHTIPAGSLNTVARVRLQVLSERDGLESWQAHEIEFDTSVAFWTPANLTTPPTLWVSDASAITEESGGVSQINDLSANSYHLSQITSSARPTAVAGELNGRRVLRFGGDDRLYSSAAEAQNVLSGAGEAWSIAVIKSSSTASGNRYYFGITESTSASNAHYLDVLSSTSGGTYTNRPGLGGRRVVGTSYSEIRSATTVGTDWHMALKRMQYASATGIVNVDGGADESAAMVNMTAGVAPTRTWSRLSLGHHASSGSAFLIGDIAEFIFGIGTLTNDERDKLFGYLAHKWALQSRLPSDHPYKTSPPTL